MLVRRSLLALLALGCTGGGGDGGFTLTLSPRFLDGQDVLDGGPQAELVIARPDGSTEVYGLGTASAGAALSAPDIAPLEPDTVVGLSLESDGDPGAIDPADSVAYGQAMVGDDLGADGVLEVLVPQTAALARLADLASAKRRMGAALAMTPDGTAWVFGGNDPSDDDSEASPQISKLAGLAAGDYAFSNVGALPSENLSYIPLNSNDPTTGDFAGRTGATATLVDYEGAPHILVVGGRSIFASPTGLYRTVLLFDPKTEKIVKDDVKLPDGRSDHVAIRFRDGKVLLYGGFTGLYIPPTPTYEIWDPATGKVRAGGSANSLAGGFLQPFGAASGDEAVVCGGLVFSQAGADYVWTPQRECDRLRSSDRVEPEADLPVPLAGAAMIELPDGDLLVTGGFTQTIVEPNATWTVVPATDGVYRLSGGTWSQVAALGHPRAYHAMVPMADGRVLIVGGTTEATTTFGQIDEPVRCTEIYNPKNDSVVEGDCNAVGQGARPAVAWTDGGHAVLLEGWFSAGSRYEGGAAYGVTSIGPRAE